MGWVTLHVLENHDNAREKRSAYEPRFINTATIHSVTEGVNDEKSVYVTCTMPGTGYFVQESYKEACEKIAAADVRNG